MTKAEALDELIEAVEAGSIPLSDLDAFIPSLGLSAQGNDAHSAYRGSLDAAKALHEALLPGWFWYGGHLNGQDDGFAFNIAQHHYPDVPSYKGFSKGNSARAWLLATLKAYRAGL